MQHLTLVDNSITKLSQPFHQCASQEEAISCYQDLQQVAGKSLKELWKGNPSLLVFPPVLGEHQDGIQELSICQLEGSPRYNQEKQIESVEEVKIKTGNLMGFIGFSGKGCHGTKLEIRSRFTDSGGQDFFLHYLLEKVFRINLFNLNYSFNQSEGFDFLYLLFPYFLRKAVRQGLFRTYKTFVKNDSAVKGPIQVSRHLRQNSPFGGKIAYKSREFTSDNHITQLIRHTIEFIKTKDAGFLLQDEETRRALHQIQEATNETYSPQSRTRVLHQNAKPLNHPYYLDYNYLQQLCLMILNNYTTQYSPTSSPIYGILFDGAWLWEEYLATILCNDELGQNKFLHPQNKAGCGGIRLFDNSATTEETEFSKSYRRIYPDFYRLPMDLGAGADSGSGKTTNSDFGMILDAKYKRLENGFVRDDLYQIISYMHTTKISQGGFIYPKPSSVDEFDSVLELNPPTYKLTGLGGTVSTFGLPIPSEKEQYGDFSSKMKEAESYLLTALVKNIDFPSA